LAQAVTPGAVVLDLGGGTGVLSALACRAGAGRVYLVEHGEIIGFTREILRDNGLSERVVCVEGLSTECELPEPVDVIVSETIGVAGFDEGILGFVIDARQRLGKRSAGGPEVIPRRLALWAAPVSDPELSDHLVTRWAQGVVGLDLHAVASRAANNLYMCQIEPGHLAADGREVVQVDLRTVEHPFVDGTVRFPFARAATVHGFAVWFAADLADGVTLTNAPDAEPRPSANVGQHWWHGFLPVAEPLQIAGGEELTLALQVNDGGLWRWRGGPGGAAHFDHCTAFGAPIRPGAPTA
jgi:protein arginine N-methyltransferase 1